MKRETGYGARSEALDAASSFARNADLAEHPVEITAPWDGGAVEAIRAHRSAEQAAEDSLRNPLGCNPVRFL